MKICNVTIYGSPFTCQPCLVPRSSYCPQVLTWPQWKAWYNWSHTVMHLHGCQVDIWRYGTSDLSQSSVQQLLNAWYLAVLVMLLEFRKPPNSWHSSLLLKVHCEVVGELYESEKYVLPKLPNLDHLWSVTAKYFFESYTSTCPPNNKVCHCMWQLSHGVAVLYC